MGLIIVFASRFGSQIGQTNRSVKKPANQALNQSELIRRKTLLVLCFPRWFTRRSNH